jgi:hypothetical protein
MVFSIQAGLTTTTTTTTTNCQQRLNDLLKPLKLQRKQVFLRNSH